MSYSVDVCNEYHYFAKMNFILINFGIDKKETKHGFTDFSILLLISYFTHPI